MQLAVDYGNVFSLNSNRDGTADPAGDMKAVHLEQVNHLCKIQCVDIYSKGAVRSVQVIQYIRCGDGTVKQGGAEVTDSDLRQGTVFGC